MMKVNPLGTILTIVLVAMALGTSVLLIGYVQMARRLQSLQVGVQIANRNQAAVQGLLNEAIEYARRDPSLDPVLQSMGVRARTNAASVPAKSATR